ncbi:MAG: RNA-directed DNA polymerase [Proteobacteria bacterium]|nr:RNA-directed DNA polymerase [Pseudomonadota bacterium]
MNFRAILIKGFFPKELPQPFSTKSFGEVITKNGANIPNEFENNKKISISAVHNLARAGALRRKLSIPNPTNFYRLSKFLVQHDAELIKLARKSDFSLTSPGSQTQPRAINPRHSLDSGPLYRAKLRSTSRFILKADISRFYPSIYTHSIPWAMHTKPVAKKNRSAGLIGNVIDLLVRNSQDAQTVGIPIGPDPSLLISEIILGAVDEKLMASQKLRAFRYIDDYEFGCKSYSEAEMILGLLQEELNHFELSLNPRKTSILKLPIRIEKTWVSELRAFSFRKTDKGQEFDLLRYFDHAFELFVKTPDEGVLKYAIARMSGIDILEKNWPLYQNILAQCCLTEPGVIKFVIEQLARYFTAFGIDNLSFEECFNEIISIHAPLGHGSEVAWAIFSLILLSLPVHQKPIEVASVMEDPVVAVLALDAKVKNLTPQDFTFDHFATHMTTENLYGDHWLLSYEANVKGWLPSVGPDDHVMADPCFKYLKDNNVSFYDNSFTLGNVSIKPLPDIKNGGVVGGEIY